MKISDISIKRPVFAIVINIVIILLGLIALDRLSIREYPDIDVPVVSVSASYQGASPEIIESQITKEIEDAVTSIDGIDYITSMSRRGRSFVNITFKPSKDIEEAANDVRDKVARAKRRFPDEVDEPVVRKSDSDADPVMILAISSDQYSPIDLSRLAKTVIKPQIELIEGVANLEIWGEREPVMRIWLDPPKMAAFDITTADIESALRTQNVEIPAGTVKSGSMEFSIISRTDLNSVEEFSNIIVKTSKTGVNQHIVRLGDVANVELGGVEETSRPRMNGQPGLGISIIKQSIANPLTLADSVRAILPQLRESLPEGVFVDISQDNSIFIKESLKSVYQTIFEALIFVGVVIFLFLRDWRATVIPMVTVPIALVGTLFLMYLLGYSINTLTLLAFVLAIGLVVDDAIVMLENIHRHIEAGMHPIAASFKGSREIGFAIIAMTITLAAVFLPLTFSEGRIGQLFVEFAMTLALAVLISGFTALTLSPMMCSRLLKPKSEQEHGRFFNLVESGLNRLSALYVALLRRVVNQKTIVVIMMLAIMGGAYYLYEQLPKTLAPIEDRGYIRVMAKSPEGATVDFTDRYFTEVEDHLLKTLDDAIIYVVSGVASGAFGFVTLQDWSERDEVQMSITQRLNKAFKNMAVGLQVFASNPPSLGQSGRSKEVEIVIRSNESFEVLDQKVSEIIRRLNQNEALVTPDHDLQMNTPQIEIDVDREKLALLGIDVNMVGRTLETALGGRNVTRFKEGAEQYDVLVQVDPSKRSQPRDLHSLYVRTKTGEMVPLSNLVTIHETIAPQILRHFNKLRSVTISANLIPGISQGEGIEMVEAVIRDVMPDALLDYQGSSREFIESGSSMVLTFGLAVIFIYLVLAAQFESWRDPLIILISVPLAGFGALGALYLTDGSINIYSQIGLVTLVGLITKHGILIVEFANQLQDEGRSRLDAIIESANLRLRPILMTTGAMVLGTLPLALATGAGAESREAIGWVIVGGMTLGTLLTLFVVPVVYLLINRHRRIDFARHEAVAQVEA